MQDALPLMTLDEVVVGKKYRCDFCDAQYFATVVGKDFNGVRVTLGDILNSDGDAGDPMEALGTRGEITVSVGQLRPM